MPACSLSDRAASLFLSCGHASPHQDTGRGLADPGMVARLRIAGGWPGASLVTNLRLTMMTGNQRPGGCTTGEPTPHLGGRRPRTARFRGRTPRHGSCCARESSPAPRQRVEGSRSAGHPAAMTRWPGTSFCLLLLMLEDTPPDGLSITELSRVRLAQPSGEGERASHPLGPRRPTQPSAQRPCRIGIKAVSRLDGKSGQERLHRQVDCWLTLHVRGGEPTRRPTVSHGPPTTLAAVPEPSLSMRRARKVHPLC